MAGLDQIVKVRVDRLMLSQLEQESSKTDRSIGAVIRLAIREHLAKKGAR